MSSTQAALQAARAREADLKRERDQQNLRLSAARKENSAAVQQATQDRARATALSAATVTAAGQLQGTEARLQILQAQVSDLHDNQTKLRTELAEDARAIAPVLPLANRLRLYPADTLLANPLPPSDAITGLLIIRGVSTTLEKRAEAIRQHRQELTQLDMRLSAKMKDVSDTEAIQASQRDALAVQARAARDAQLRSNAAAHVSAEKAAQEAARASSLQDAINQIVATEASAMAQLQREAAAAERAHKLAAAAEARRHARQVASGESAGPGPTAAVVQAAGPHIRGGGGVVTGALITAWHQQTDAGPASGVSYSVASGGSVRAPCTGSVEFASTFRSYGQMLILNCGRGYRFVLAGLGSLDVAPGQTLSKGASVGSMPSGGGNSTLMIQLRRGQTTVDPAPYL